MKLKVKKADTIWQALGVKKERQEVIEKLSVEASRLGNKGDGMLKIAHEVSNREELVLGVYYLGYEITKKVMNDDIASTAKMLANKIGGKMFFSSIGAIAFFISILGTVIAVSDGKWGWVAANLAIAAVIFFTHK